MNNYISIILQGGLGNQLFQIGAATAYCEKYNKKIIISKDKISENPHQSLNKIINNLNILFPDIKIIDKLDNVNYIMIFDKENDVFTYNDNISLNIGLINNNILIQGYFINNKYLPKLFKCNIIPSNSNLKFNDFDNTFFIHIRLGDYLKGTLYNMKLNNYYNYCINNITKSNINAKFIICTNEYGSNLDNYINNFPKNIEYIIQDKNDDELDTLFIMSSCKGGICSNSTLSWMGSYFQKNKNKEYIYMPYPWINFINGFNYKNTIDVYPEWTQIYDTINNNIMLK